MSDNKTKDNTVVAVSGKKLKRLLNLRRLFVKDEPSKKAVVNAAMDHLSDYYEEQRKKK